MITVAVQGREASFHYQAAHRFFANQEITILGFDSFAETFDALAAHQAEYAVVAVENSIHGAINETYDRLEAHNLWICGEQYLRIEQNLIGLPGATLGDITDIYSHFAALTQCRQFLDTALPDATRHVHPDTAGAVADIKKWQNARKAAIASRYAAEFYGLPILAEAIETNHHNYTRFALLRHDHTIPSDATKTTLLLQLQSHTGALHEVLGIFAAHKLDLTMLTSRPVVGQPGTYQFFIDLAAGAHEHSFGQATEEISANGDSLRILGSYTPLTTLADVAS